MRLAITSNGPGEFAGWVRPLVAALTRLAPETDVTLFCVPDDYATGREPDVARRLFPHLRVVAAPDYVRFALGRRVSGVPERADVVQYLGGDLAHAARVRVRLAARARGYKFARRRDAKTVDGTFALDARNAADLARAGFAGRTTIVGNLAIDGALAEAAGAFPASGPEPEIAPGGVLFMPGARKHEIANITSMWAGAAIALRALAPELPIAFAISPFTTRDELARAFASGGHRNVWGARGTLVPHGAGFALQPATGGAPFPVVCDAMRHAARAKLAVTLPGTKCVELAALGVPAVVCTPLNAPEVVVINGPLQYLDRIPRLGDALKRAAVIAVDARFAYTAQPNIDAGEALMPELRGTLMPGEIARRVAAYAADADALATASARLRALYAAHAGAAERMARALLEAYA